MPKKSRRQSYRKSSKKCPEGSIAVKGRSRRGKRSASYCRKKGVRVPLVCPDGMIKVKSRRSRSGKRSPAYCRKKGVRVPLVCPPGTIKIKSRRSKSRSKKNRRVKAHCRKSRS